MSGYPYIGKLKEDAWVAGFHKGDQVKVLRSIGNGYVTVTRANQGYKDDSFLVREKYVIRIRKRTGQAGDPVNNKHKPPPIPKGKGKVHKKVKKNGKENGGNGKEQAQGNEAVPPLHDDEKKEEEPHFGDDKETNDEPDELSAKTESPPQSDEQDATEPQESNIPDDKPAKDPIDSPPKKEHKLYKINRRPKDDIDSDDDNATDNETQSDQKGNVEDAAEEK